VEKSGEIFYATSLIFEKLPQKATNQKAKIRPIWSPCSRASTTAAWPLFFDWGKMPEMTTVTLKRLKLALLNF
jgi:hypothetical protein